MNFEKKGQCYFRIYNTKTKKYRDVYISANEAKQNIDVLRANPDEEFVLVPNEKIERQVMYITGRSGAGKSYVAGKYADEYHKTYPKRDIILFSLVPEDDSIDRKFIKKIDLEKLSEAEDLTLEDFKDTLCIFDDVDGDLIKKHKVLASKMKSIQDQILLMGRHYNVSALVLAHEGCRAKESKRILNECSSITIFPYHMKNHDLKYITAEYWGLSLSQRKRLLEVAKDSRSVTYIMSYPPVIFSSKLCYILEPDIV